MFVLLLVLPLCSFIIICLFSSFFGRNGVLFYSILNMSVVNILSLYMFLLILFNNYSIYLIFNNWFFFLNFDVSWLFRLDALSVSMAYVVSLISLFVHIYSIDYMYGDPNRSLFLGFLSLFTFFMLLLVCSGNMILFFMSWEGVGVCSYLLINFWNSRIIATQSAVKALLVNRVSDLFLFLGLLQLSLLYGSVDFTVVEFCIYLSKYSNIFIFGCFCNMGTICSFFLLVGVVGKSAQLFLHTWLPDAMEGPTPVSALLHAATMVTAGIFLVLRFSFIFEANSYVLQCAGLLGAITILVSGTIGLFQFDIKKVIAYSTCSQLGYMLVACSASVYYVSLYHFTIHAFFKALLFLLAGCIIHSMSNEQDMRKYGGLLYSLPMCFILFLIGSSALVAEPFLSGYYSKEFIIFSLNDVYVSTYNFVYWLSLYGAILTILYSTRSMYLVFFSNFRGFFTHTLSIHELSYILIYPLSILAIFSLFSGYLYSAIFRDGSLFLNFNTSTIHMLSNHYVYDFISLEHNYITIFCNMVFVLLFVFCGYLNSVISTRFYSVIRCFFINKWFFDIVYNRVLVLGTLLSSDNIYNKYLDKGYIETFGPLGMYSSIYYYLGFGNLKNYTIFSDVLYVFIYVLLIFVVLLCSYYFVDLSHIII